MELGLTVSELGLFIFGFIVVAFMTTFTVVTGLVFIFYLYSKVFMPKQKQSESLQYKLLKDFVYPMLKSGINDLTQKGMDVMDETSKKESKSKEKKNEA